MFFSECHKRNDQQGDRDNTEKRNSEHTKSDKGEGPQKMTKTRRGPRKPKIRSLSCYAINIRGFTSKQDSLSSILENVEPDIVSLCEIKLNSTGNLQKFFKQRGYQVLTRTAGGIAVAASLRFKFINVTSSHNMNLIVGLCGKITTLTSVSQ